jgi:sigma-E factor negative regulatory protein RseA
MSEHFSERLSEFVDDEMSADECEFFVRRLQRDDDARGRFFRYQLIGAAVRGEHIHLSAVDLTQRLRKALESDPVTAAPVRKRRFTGARLAAGAGIAASVALLALAVFRLTEVDSQVMGDGAVADVPFEAAETTAEAQLARVQAEVTGIQFLIHHTGYSSGLTRTIMHSSVVAGRNDEVSRQAEAEPLE